LIKSILHQGENPIVDKLLGFLQNALERKIPFVPYARLAGADGLRLTRAAFAVMIKFSEFFDSFQQIVDEVDMQWSTLEGDPEQEIKVKEIVKSMPHYDMILKRWDSASKMRQWVNEKKNNLAEKVKKDVEAEYMEKKKESPKEEKPADDSKPAEEAKDGEKKEDAPVNSEEIVLIDTSSKPAEEVHVDGNGFTDADKAAIEELFDKKFNEELQTIYTKIIEKAEFLVKLQVPGSYLVKDPTKKKEGVLLMLKEPSKDGSETSIDWKDRLKSWRQMQTSKGSIRSFTERKKEIFDSSVMSILSCL